MSTLNQVDIYDWSAWINLSPDYDWDELLPDVEITAPAPTFDDDANTYAVPAKTGVRYLVGGSVVTGTNPVGDVSTTVTIDAEALEGYSLVGTTTWTGTFTKAPVEVAATAPTFDDEADTYKIPQKAGVQYLVDGVATAAKTVTVGDVDATIVVTAEAKEGYVLTGTATWTGVFTKAPEVEEPDA